MFKLFQGSCEVALNRPNTMVFFSREVSTQKSAGNCNVLSLHYGATFF